jgi:lipoate synthase
VTICQFLTTTVEEIKENRAMEAAPKPNWLKVRAPGGERYLAIKELLVN